MLRDYARIRVRLVKEIVYVRDNGSLHGTTLNDKKIPTRKDVSIHTFGNKFTRGSKVWLNSQTPSVTANPWPHWCLRLRIGPIVTYSGPEYTAARQHPVFTHSFYLYSSALLCYYRLLTILCFILYLVCLSSPVAWLRLSAVPFPRHWCKPARSGCVRRHGFSSVSLRCRYANS